MMRYTNSHYITLHYRQKPTRALPVVFAAVLEVVHVASDVLVHGVILLSLPGDAEVNEVTGVFNNKLTATERTSGHDPATFARNFHHLQHSSILCNGTLLQNNLGMLVPEG